jgi:hypothetical protein
MNTHQMAKVVAIHLAQSAFAAGATSKRQAIDMAAEMMVEDFASLVQDALARLNAKDLAPRTIALTLTAQR